MRIVPEQRSRSTWRFLVLGIAPILAYGTIFWTNRVTPWLLGFPFFMAWLFLCQIISWIGLLIVYFFDPENKPATDTTPPLLEDANPADHPAIKDTP